ncbi:hypothetical protein [Belliella pelovolcani]|uniref:hypothetical protein n=1 Tax=Belliella pelovolcani TaxID=529505 RepID=UPI00391CDFCF
MNTVKFDFKQFQILVIVGFCLLSSCTLETEYEKIKKRELASGKVYKDLFLGLEFEMARKQFFETCWELNQQGILINGAHELMVRYQPELPSGNPVNMFFYPRFEEEKIYYMPVEFQYQNWFPTNQETTAEKLVDDVVGLFESWYGQGFFKVEDKSGAFAMVKIDGNRLIRVYIKSLSAVRVDILDMRIKDIKDVSK